MTSNNEAKLNMYNAVAAFLQTNNAAFAAVPALAAAITTFNTRLQELKDAATEEAQIITGITKNKGNLKKTLCETAATNAAILFAYATAENNEELKAKARISYSDFSKLRDEDLTLYSQNISTALTASQAALAGYGITAAVVTEFNTLIAQYNSAVPSPRNAASLRKTYSLQLKELFKTVDTILKLQIDKLMLQFKKSNTNLYNDYKENRTIVNAPVSKTKLSGTITSTVDNTALANVTVQVLNTSYGESSNSVGKYNVIIPVPGAYSITFSKTGYQPKTINGINMQLGQTTTLNTALDITP